MSIFDTKKKEDTLKKLAKQSLHTIPSFQQNQQSSFIKRVRALFSTPKQKKDVLLRVATGREHGFPCKEKMTPEDTMQLEYSAILDTKTFNTIKNTKQKSKRKLGSSSTTEDYRGEHLQFMDIHVDLSKETQGIAEECIHSNPTTISSRQSIQTLPQLCHHYLLTKEEIRTLCYIIYDCTYVRNSESFQGQSPMLIARYLCRERRHILRFSLVEYASLLQHIAITHSTLSILEILTWMNAISRMARIVTSLTSIPHNSALLMSLVWLPRNAIITLTKGRTLDKSLLSLIRSDAEITLSKLQSYIIIVAVARIIVEQFDKSVIYDPTQLLLRIEPKQYMQNNNPISSLMQIFQDIHTKYYFLLQSNTEYFLHALEQTSIKNESEDLMIQLHEVNTILYTVRRIEQLYNRVMTKEEVFAIINKLSQSTVEIIRFYGIHPREFFTEDNGFYFPLVQLLAYIQYNKINEVTPQTAILMRFIPLHTYQNAEKPYEELQKQCNEIIKRCPRILEIDEVNLENIFLEKLLLEPIDTERSLPFFENIELIVIACAKIQSIQLKRGTHAHEVLYTLCNIPHTTLTYITHFPEIFFSRLIDDFPAPFFDSIYSALQEYCTTKSFHYKVLACYISPLSIAGESTSASELTMEMVTPYIERTLTLLNAMNTELSCREGYTNDTLFNALSYLMPLYYKYPMRPDAPLRLVQHVNQVLEVITGGSHIPLQELCSKPKRVLQKYRKDQQEDTKDRL
ncbi:MAG: hypothetical protein K2M30_01165 [Desulfovibrionaceae bacterium]|nr:hypothetical protein [Desulfovibrionaceae bacterium]